MSAADSAEMDEAMQQYQEAMQNMTPEQREMLEQMGMADMSQMIVITHNKITMEAMDLLVGVTMAEAGVSRLVSVDIEQAVEMVSQ